MWSLQLARSAQTILGVVTRIHHENNHHLNTAWMVLVGPDASAFTYRLLAIVTSTATVLLSATVPLRRAPYVAAATGTLIAFSEILVHYGSEARGYAPAMLGAFVGFHALARFWETGRDRWAAVFALSSVFALLSHLTSVYALTGFAAWIGVEVWRRPRPHGTSALLLASPFAGAVTLWLVDVGRMELGGGNATSVTTALADLAVYSFALPGALTAVAVCAASAAIANEVGLLIRARDSRAAFFVAAALAPAVVIGIRHPEVLAARYFVVLVPFAFMLLGSALARLAARGKTGLACTAALLAVFVAASVAGPRGFARANRGRYRDTISFIVGSTPGPVTIGSDHDGRNESMIYRAAREIGALERVTYVAVDGWTSGGPEWVLMHFWGDAPQVPRSFIARTRRLYALEGVFPSSGLSGWTWAAYRMR